MGPDVAQHEAQGARSPAATAARAGDVGARGFEQLAVLHARRADALAGAAAEAALDVARERAGLYAQPPLLDRAHQVDAPARAVVLVARLHVGRAGFEAQPAVDAREQLALLGDQRARELCRTFRH